MWLSVVASGLIATGISDGGVACASLPAAWPSAREGPMAETVMGNIVKVPPPRRHLPIPHGPSSSIRIRLTRSNCFGTCPAYSIELHGDGSASYNGAAHVLVPGKHIFAVPTSDVQCLLQQFRAADFWSLRPKYVTPVTDNPFYSITLEIGGQKKTVVDYVGRAVGMPVAVAALEDSIDRIAADRWTRGDSHTIMALKAKRFDFRSRRAGAILAAASESAPEPVIIELLAEGAPANGRVHMMSFGHDEGDGQTAIELASLGGRSVVVRALVSGGALSYAPAGLKEEVLRDASQSGVPDVVAQVLRLSPNVNAADADGDTPLLLIWKARYSRPESSPVDYAGVARLLLAAGADPKARNKDGSNALHWAEDGAAVHVLVDAGVPLEGRDSEGRTPLLCADTDDAAVALIESGADTSAKSAEGDTVVQLAEQYHYPKTLALLRARRN
jgi:hypothetical protein